MSNASPPRIDPFYEVPDDGSNIILLESEEAELTQNGKTFKGTLRVVQQWSPMIAFVDFEKKGIKGEIKHGDASVSSSSIKTDIRVANILSDSIRGIWSGSIEVGSDHKLDRVTFHLPNYPDLFGGKKHSDELVIASVLTSTSWSEVILEVDDWKIEIQPHKNIFFQRHDYRKNELLALSGIGQVSKSDGSEFSKEDVKPILYALRFFLSFSFAEWSPPLLVVGSNSHTDKSWKMWSNFGVTCQWSSNGWIDDLHGKFLGEAFPKFYKLYSKEEWKIPIEQTITWLIEASNNTGNPAGPVAFGQIPLEMLAWMVFVDDQEIIGSDEFKRLSAASKLKMLFNRCGIPFEIPAGLAALNSLVTSEAKETNKISNGPDAVTKVRNCIIHPNKKNRQTLSDWASQCSVRETEILWETQQLFKWYNTLVLLSMIGYSGKYANRLTSHKFGDVEPVPWAK